MKLHLDHQPVNPGFFIGHADRVFFSGSCFSENILEKMHQAGFSVARNPAGIVFHPLVIARELESIISNEPPEPALFLDRSGIFYSYESHSSVHAKDKKELEIQIVAGRKSANAFLRNCKVLILSFGSAFYYRHRASEKMVANCHKQAQQEFEKLRSQPEEITAAWKKTITLLKNFNPDLKIIFTVSPVKHLRDGMEENTLSKSILLYACRILTENNNNCFYFPAYELITDDLRDYRFFEKDLAHPNEQAIEYVWEKFINCYFNSATQKTKDLAEQLYRANRHVLIHDNEEERAKFQAHIQRLRGELAAALQNG